MSAINLVEVDPTTLPDAGKELVLPHPPLPATLRRPLAGWMAQFLDHMARSEQKSDNTLRHYAHDLELFSRYLKAYAPHVSSPRDVDLEVITGFFRYLRIVRGNSLTSSRRRLVALRRFFGYLVHQGVIAGDPTATVAVRPTDRRHAAALTREEAQRLLQAARMSPFAARDYAMLRLFLSCGCTLSELLSLKLSDVDLKEQAITVTGRRGNPRTLSLTPVCVGALQEYLECRPKAPAARALFLNRRGKPMTKGAVYYALRQALRRAGIQRPGITVHSLRRTCLTLLWEAGVPLRTLQHIAGHASLATTKGYTVPHDRSAPSKPRKVQHPLDG